MDVATAAADDAWFSAAAVAAMDEPPQPHPLLPCSRSVDLYSRSSVATAAASVNVVAQPALPRSCTAMPGVSGATTGFSSSEAASQVRPTAVRSVLPHQRPRRASPPTSSFSSSSSFSSASLREGANAVSGRQRGMPPAMISPAPPAPRKLQSQRGERLRSPPSAATGRREPCPSGLAGGFGDGSDGAGAAGSFFFPGDGVDPEWFERVAAEACASQKVAAAAAGAAGRRRRRPRCASPRSPQTPRSPVLSSPSSPFGCAGSSAEVVLRAILTRRHGEHEGGSSEYDDDDLCYRPARDRRLAAAGVDKGAANGSGTGRARELGPQSTHSAHPSRGRPAAGGLAAAALRRALPVTSPKPRPAPRPPRGKSERKCCECPRQRVAARPTRLAAVPTSLNPSPASLGEGPSAPFLVGNASAAAPFMVEPECAGSNWSGPRPLPCCKFCGARIVVGESSVAANRDSALQAARETHYALCRSNPCNSASCPFCGICFKSTISSPSLDAFFAGGPGMLGSLGSTSAANEGGLIVSAETLCAWHQQNSCIANPRHSCLQCGLQFTNPHDLLSHHATTACGFGWSAGALAAAAAASAAYLSPPSGPPSATAQPQSPQAAADCGAAFALSRQGEEEIRRIEGLLSACGSVADERQLVKQLLLRWHPDKAGPGSAAVAPAVFAFVNRRWQRFHEDTVSPRAAASK